ncbi:MAG: hypothetical protein IH898_01695 [Planctomycetes bacterium]|nr:hypothetical protein [Planctomycetota bacterium]
MISKSTTTKGLSSGYMLSAVLAVFALLASGCRRGDELGPVADADAFASIRTALSQGSEGAGGGTAGPTGTGWATLKGRFIFDGTAPTMPPYNVNRDQATCNINGKAPLQETILVDPATNGLANVAIFIRNASRVHESAASPATESAEFDQKTCVFLTHVFPLTLGQTMQIKNSDNVGHNTKIGGDNVFNQTIPAGEVIDFTPQKEEALPVAVACSIHPWMLAYFLPRKNGYYAVTGPDGSFEIANVPAGEELEFQVWHESGTGTRGALVLGTPEAKKLKWSKKGRFKVTLTQDDVKEIEITVPASALGG